jgi:hypothetical protein
MVCPKCGGTMKVIAFITEFSVVDRIINYLKLTFVAEKPPPSRVFEQAALIAAEERILFVEMMVWPPGLPMTQWGLPFFAIIVGVMLDRGLFPGAGRLARPKPPGFTLQILDKGYVTVRYFRLC